MTPEPCLCDKPSFRNPALKNIYIGGGRICYNMGSVKKRKKFKQLPVEQKFQKTNIFPNILGSFRVERRLNQVSRTDLTFDKSSL